MARKEIRSELGGLRKSVAAQRSEILALKRGLKDLAAQVKVLHKVAARQASAGEVAARSASASGGRKRRFQFDAKALAAKREQLGISQQAMAVLLGVSALSVYKWESGRVTPRTSQLERIQSVLKMGKREATARLQG